MVIGEKCDMKDWYKLVHAAKTEAEKNEVLNDIYFEVGRIDLIEDSFDFQDMVDAMEKIIDKIPMLLVDEFREIGLDVTSEEITTLSAEKKRYIIEEIDNLREAWEIITMLV